MSVQSCKKIQWNIQDRLEQQNSYERFDLIESVAVHTALSVVESVRNSFYRLEHLNSYVRTEQGDSAIEQQYDTVTYIKPRQSNVVEQLCQICASRTCSTVEVTAGRHSCDTFVQDQRKLLCMKLSGTSSVHRDTRAACLKSISVVKNTLPYFP